MYGHPCGHDYVAATLTSFLKIDLFPFSDLLFVVSAP